MAITATLKDGGPYNITANGTYKIRAKGALGLPGNFNTAYVNGTFGGATFKFQVTPDETDTNAFDIANGSLTAPGFLNILAKSNDLILVVSGGTGINANVWVL